MKYLKTFEKYDSKKGKKCKRCGHAIYYSKPLQSWRCGPGCDEAEAEYSVFDKHKSKAGYNRMSDMKTTEKDIENARENENVENKQDWVIKYTKDKTTKTITKNISNMNKSDASKEANANMPKDFTGFTMNPVNTKKSESRILSFENFINESQLTINAVCTHCGKKQKAVEINYSLDNVECKFCKKEGCLKEIKKTNESLKPGQPYANTNRIIDGVIILNSFVDYDINPLFYVWSEYPKSKEIKNSRLQYQYEFYTDNQGNKYFITDADNKLSDEEIKEKLSKANWGMARNVDRFVNGADKEDYIIWIEDKK